MKNTLPTLSENTEQITQDEKPVEIIPNPESITPQDVVNTLENLDTLFSSQEGIKVYIENLTPIQKEALSQFILSYLQLQISSNKAVIKDLLDGGFGYFVVGDFFQVFFAFQLLYVLHKNECLDTKSTLLTLGISAVDVGVGLFVGPGDMAEILLVGNTFIRGYFEWKLKKSLENCESLHISPTILSEIIHNQEKMKSVLSTLQPK